MNYMKNQSWYLKLITLTLYLCITSTGAESADTKKYYDMAIDYDESSENLKTNFAKTPPATESETSKGYFQNVNLIF